MLQKGFIPVVTLIIVCLIIAAGLLISKNQKTKLPVEIPKTQRTSSPSAIISNPSVTPSILPSVTPNVISTPSPTPLPIGQQPISVTKVYLGRSNNDILENASGEVEIRLMKIDPYMSPDAKVVSLQYDIHLRNLESEREYYVSICTILEGGDCVALASVKTDKSGFVNFSGNSGITYVKSRPFKAIKVNQSNGGFCSNAGSPCLRGELSINIPD